jgi:hypothetical protein
MDQISEAAERADIAAEEAAEDDRERGNKYKRPNEAVHLDGGACGNVSEYALYSRKAGVKSARHSDKEHELYGGANKSMGTPALFELFAAADGFIYILFHSLTLRCLECIGNGVYDAV